MTDRAEVERGKQPSCYLTGVLGRFVCASRWPGDPGRWCDGCVLVFGEFGEGT